jgi:Fic family protein
MQIVSGPTGYEKVHYEAPAGASVPGEVNTFLKWYNETTPSVNSDPGIPGLVRAAVAHAWLELVHPFDDGNGRVGRAVTDHALYQDMRSVPLFSLSATIEKNRNTYYEKLATVNRSLDFTEWVMWFAETACEAQIEARNALAFALEKTRFWDEFGETVFNSRQTKAINRMFRAGPAGFEGGMTARKYTNLTGASRATATRDLGDLVGKGALKVEGRGRSVSYVLVLPGKEPGFLERILSPKPM